MAEQKPQKLSKQQKHKQNRKPHAHCVNKPSSAKDVRINLRRAKFKSRRNHSDSEDSDTEQYLVAPQPKSHWVPYDKVSDVEEDGKDFETLSNAPISVDGHFSFKGEKDWNFDISQSSELFSPNLKLLNAAVSCIPFYERIGLDESYFSKDQLTFARSEAELAKKRYEDICKELIVLKTTVADETIRHKSVKISNTETTTNFVKRNGKQAGKTEKTESSEIENLEDELDFLLSLKEPLMPMPREIPQIASTSKLEEPKCKSASVPTKSVDLEKWLDSVLDV